MLLRWDPPDSDLNFLRQQRTSCILNGIQEGVATYVLIYFLNGSSQEKADDMLAPIFPKSLDRTDSSPRSATWTELVQFLMIRNAREETLAYAYERFFTYMQVMQQEEMEY